MNVIKEIRLICIDMVSNENKTWVGTAYDNGDIKTQWGRVGYELQSKDFPGAGIGFLEKKEREKLKKGYTPLKTVAKSSTTVVEVKQGTLHDVAKTQILKTSNSMLDKLIARLVKSNVHKIIASTNITFDDSTGLFSTPLGIVTPEGILEARDLLVQIQKNLSSENQLRPIVGQYLRIVPHATGMGKLNVYNLFPDKDAVKKELDILDSLEASYTALSTTKPTKAGDKTVEEKVFDVDLDLVSPSNSEYNRLDRWYETSKKSMHGYGSIKVTNIYRVDIKEMTSGFNTKLGNVMEVFHGTSEANVLSILKSGLKVSPPSTAYIAGKMFGNGTYGAINSSKSIGYSMGRWGGANSDYGYLFVADFAMGKIQYPNTYGGGNFPSHGHDSVWAKAQNTGLHNDELIVYKNNQCKIKYLLEIK